KSREFDSPGIYAYTVYNEHCTAEDQIAVNRVDPPSIFFEENQVVICEDQSVWLNPQVSNFDSLHWENGEVSQRILVENSGQFAVTAVNECGSVMAEIEVIEEECFCSIYIPNSFSPNGDGLNDVFKAVTDCEVTQFTLSVFDRWGKEVWSSSDIDESWRGGDSHFSKGDLYNYRYSAILNKNGKDYFRDGSGMISIIR
ncbi:MAG: gliding motility-associated C-terminal domain-containing protein, partial [Bacteroidota bacterium]